MHVLGDLSEGAAISAMDRTIQLNVRTANGLPFRTRTFEKAKSREDLAMPGSHRRALRSTHACGSGLCPGTRV